MNRHFRASLLLVAIVTAGAAFAQSQTATTEIAPSGRLRVGLIGSNPVLVTRMPDGSAGGVSAALGKFIADKLGVPFEPVVYANPAAYTESFDKGAWDIGIAAKDPSRAAKLDFSPDFMLVDNVFVAAPGRHFRDAAAVDRAGVKIGVPANSAPDHFLTHTFKSAELVRVQGGIDIGVELLKSGKADVYAENAFVGYAIADRLPGASVVPGQFNTVHMAIAVPKGRSPDALAALSRLVEEANRVGIVDKAIAAAGLRGVHPVK